MTLLDEIEQNRVKILALASECGLKDVRIFGSVARKQETANSDIDILVNLDKTLGLKNFGFSVALQEMFGRKVDMVFEKGLHWTIKEDVLKEAKSI